ncbi:MAG TPA: HAMP domain-containing sensor histidine kinase [Kofleriaceae bacterium]
MLAKLLGALVLPVVVLFALFAVVAYEVSRRDLDEELGRRLTAIAASASTQVRGKYLADLVPGNEDDRAYQNVAKKLETLSAATGARLFVFDRTYNARVDTAEQKPIGTHNYRAELDRAELVAVFAGTPRASVTFEGNDGITYKTGYAPVRASETEPEIVLALGAQAPASYFARLSDLRTRLLAWGAGLALVSILAAVLATFLITRNVRRLAAAAERIGAGDLHEPVVATSRDELGVLAKTMERMRGQLAERDAKMQQMLAGIAHEVRNPLAGMTLFAGILRDEVPEGDERRGHVDKIQRELDYLERVVNDFLEYARRPKPELADVPIADLFAEVIELAPAEPEISQATTVVTIRADRGQLRRALLNLVRNASQAAASAGHTGPGNVSLRAVRTADRTELSVWNRGKEIPPETSGRLFEPFYTTREKGTGLGLAFVRDITADHGGSVRVESADGETTFVISLP